MIAGRRRQTLGASTVITVVRALRPQGCPLDLKSVPILPSLITLGNLFFGFLAMAKVADAVWLGPAPSAEVIAVFEAAVLLVLVAMVLDAIDGRVARMTGQTTAFGAQLDSLCDVVTFGVAPEIFFF